MTVKLNKKPESEPLGLLNFRFVPARGFGQLLK